MLIGLISAGSALAGAVIGAGATALVTWIQQRAETRRHLVRLAAEIELEHLKVAAEGTGLNTRDSVRAIVDHYVLLRELSKRRPDPQKIEKMLKHGQPFRGVPLKGN